MKPQLIILCALVFGMAFTNPKTNFLKKHSGHGVDKPTTVVLHLNNVVDDNSHTITKILFNINDNGGTITINGISLYDDNSCCGGSTCDDYDSEAWPSGSITHSGIDYSANSLHLTYIYPGGGSGSVTLNTRLAYGGIICD